MVYNKKSYFLYVRRSGMKKFLGSITAMMALSTPAMLLLSADCATGGDCTFVNDSFFIKVVTPLRPTDPLKLIKH